MCGTCVFVRLIVLQVLSRTDSIIRLSSFNCWVMILCGPPSIVFGDISKAFDRVWHIILLFKLEQYGIKLTVLIWLSDYIKYVYVGPDMFQVNGDC